MLGIPEGELAKTTNSEKTTNNISLLKIAQRFSVTPYGGISIIYINPTPIAELTADTSAELKPKAGDSIGLTNLGKVSTRIKSGFGMFE